MSIEVAHCGVLERGGCFASLPHTFSPASLGSDLVALPGSFLHAKLPTNAPRACALCCAFA
jgi:hypothetical protein